MPTKKFTDRWIAGVSTEKSQEEFFDQSFKLRGISFGVRVSRRGSKDYFIRYRNKAGKKAFYRLGSALELSLAEAHAQASALKVQINAGEDPSSERMIYKSAETVAELWTLFHTRYALKNQRPRTYIEHLRVVERDVLPFIGPWKACDVKRRDIIELIDRVGVERIAPAAARRLRVILHSLFVYGMEHDIVESNPCVALPKLQRIKPRDRVLSEDEIQKVWTALDQLTPTMQGIFKLILLTGQRPGEVTGMRLSEIDGVHWTIPKERSKNKRSNLVPLSSYSQEVLKEMIANNQESKSRSRLADRSHYDEFVFPTRKQGQHVEELQGGYLALVKFAGVSHFTAHDLRTTASTHMRRLGVDRTTVDMILNHIPQDVTSRHYDFYDGLKEKTAALELWSAEIRRIVTVAQVVELKLAS